MDLPLAAYGALRPGCGGAKHLGIEDKLEDLGPCTLPGKLWLTKGSALETEGICLVPAFYPEEEGEVLARLWRVPEEVWGIIDEFEDFVPHDTASSYIREEIITLEGDNVWVYRANHISRSNYLRDGDWMKYASHPRAIPLFPATK